jgi:hypothetical protein
MPQTLNDGVKQNEIDTGVRDGLSTADLEHIKALERDNKELRRANDSLKLVSGFFRLSSARLPTKVLIDFIDCLRDVFEDEPMRKILQVVLSSLACQQASLWRRQGLDTDRAAKAGRLKPNQPQQNPGRYNALSFVDF